MKKCPRCELNYINENQELCAVCIDALKHEKNTLRADSNKAIYTFSSV